MDYYLVVAAKSKKADSRVLDELLSKLSARRDDKTESKICWKFEKEKLTDGNRIDIHFALHPRFSYCLVEDSAPLGDQIPLPYSPDGFLDFCLRRMKTESRLDLDGALQTAEDILERVQKKTDLRNQKTNPQE